MSVLGLDVGSPGVVELGLSSVSVKGLDVKLLSVDGLATDLFNIGSLCIVQLGAASLDAELVSAQMNGQLTMASFKCTYVIDAFEWSL